MMELAERRAQYFFALFFLLIDFIPYSQKEEEHTLEPHKCIHINSYQKKASFTSHFLFFHYFKEYATEYAELLYQIRECFIY